MSAAMAVTMAMTAAAVLAADTADEATASQTTLRPPVYLYGVADLEKLRQANPGHYARAEQVIAASDEICKPGKDEVHFAKFDAKDVTCQNMILKTSNPPKREIGFTLDEVRYVALITLTDSEAQFRRVPLDGARK
jgi:hypothetical protein